MDDHDFEGRLTRALHGGVDPLTPPVPTLVAGAVERGRAARRRRRGYALASVVAAAALTTGGIATYSATRGGDAAPDPGVGDSPSQSPSASPRTSAVPEPLPLAECRAVTRGDVLPPWARTGFSDARPRVTHVTSAHGRMVAILFGSALYSPPSQEVNNKILWVGKPLETPVQGDAEGGPTSLTIEAQLAGTDTVVRRTVEGGPGPSIIDLPLAGCWRLTLQWGPDPAQQDTMDLRYVAPKR